MKDPYAAMEISAGNGTDIKELYPYDSKKLLGFLLNEGTCTPPALRRIGWQAANLVSDLAADARCVQACAHTPNGESYVSDSEKHTLAMEAIAECFTEGNHVKNYARMAAVYASTPTPTHTTCRAAIVSAAYAVQAAKEAKQERSIQTPQDLYDRLAEWAREYYTLSVYRKG